MEKKALTNLLMFFFPFFSWPKVASSQLCPDGKETFKRVLWKELFQCTVLNKKTGNLGLHKDQIIFALKQLGYRTIYCNYQLETGP